VSDRGVRPEELAHRVASIGDAKARVAWLRTVVSDWPDGELHELVRMLVERAGLRDSAAQVALLALTEAIGGDPRSRRRDASLELETVYRADWGTGRPLTLGERKSLARRPDRRLLDRALRDGHPDVVAQLLVNPRLTEPDVVRMCAAPDVQAGTLRQVFASPRWAVCARVRRAIASNPNTPVEVALALVPLLARVELRELAADARIANAVRARAIEILRRLPPTPASPVEPQ
jgi:hypothetical protein